ncbi:MAG: AAA family ATPase, partial [Nitriliruptorales bacterium]|nr:AAA family ATPase [Nitriliruptorales bacterium]
GIGKSRLLSALIDGAARRGFTTMVGHCIDMGEGALPFAPVAQALRSSVRRVDDDAVDQVTGPGRSALARILPELADGSASDVRQEGEARAHVFAAVMDMLGRIAADQPLLVAFEDIHWADRSTLDLLDYIARNLLTESLLVVASFRTDELHRRHPLRVPLAELGRLRRVTRIDLAPFGADDVAAQLARILDRPPDPELVEIISERSGGNPFYVEELLAAVRDQDGELRPDVLPPALHDVVAGRVEALPDDVRGVLAVAAVAGERVDHRLLELVDRLGDLDLVGALRQAVEHGVLLTDAEGYRFRHALVREVIYDDLLPGERTSLHRAIAETLEAHPDAAARGAGTVDAEVAHHWYVAHDSARALRASLRAADAATQAAAYTEAFRNYERALELWDGAPDAVEDKTRTEVMDAAADAAHLAGEPRRAISLMQEVIDSAPADADPVVMSLRYQRLGNYLAHVDELAQVLSAWERAKELVPEHPPTAARARVLSSYARGVALFQPGEGVEIAEEALHIARDIGDEDAEVVALLTLGHNLAPAGELDLAVARLREGLALAERRGDPREIGRCYLSLSAILIRAGRANEGAEISLEGKDRVAQLGVERLYWARMAGNATSGLFWAGRWEEAAALLDELGERTSGVEWLLLLQARLQAYRGDLEEARRTLETAVDFGADRDARYPAIAIAVELFDGELQAAHRLATSARSEDVPAHAATVNSLRSMALQVEADRFHDPDRDLDDSELRHLADEILAETTDHLSGGLGHAEPWKLTAVAEHSRIADHPAPEKWRAALGSWRGIEWPYQVAYTAFRLAEAEFEAGDDGSAPLREAAGIAGRLSAQPLLRDVEQLAGEHGVELAEATP